MTQIARNLIDTESGFLRGARYLILDRDTKYSGEFRHALDREGIRLVRLPPRSPNLNAFAERFVRSIKSECLNRMIFFGSASLQHAIGQFMEHYHAERNHQGLENQLLRPNPIIVLSRQVRRRQRLGGVLDYYHRRRLSTSFLFLDTTRSGQRTARGAFVRSSKNGVGRASPRTHQTSIF